MVPGSRSNSEMGRVCMRADLIVFLIVFSLASCAKQPMFDTPQEQENFDASDAANEFESSEDFRGIDTYAFLENYRIQHYLSTAIELQLLEPDERAARLRSLAIDPVRGSEVFPLCRMLFTQRPDEEFRRPAIGAASFITFGDYSDWPLEPITIYRNVPILIVRGYSTGGLPEPPDVYVESCLFSCQWTDTIFVPINREELKNTIEMFINENSMMQSRADWLRAQAE